MCQYWWSPGWCSPDIVPPGVLDSKEHLVTITITITSCGNDIDISDKLCVLVKTLFRCQLVVGAQILCLLVSQTPRSTIDNNALWRNPRVVECPGALVSLLLQYSVSMLKRETLFCWSCVGAFVCIYMFFCEYDVSGMCSSLCSCICMSTEHACDSL